ncbi:hypothetical protein CERSUDRAFT_161359 [Gelatoporia subvermispora B]|uniref:Uncharacterized protein n=1 Tax=Ceriporiopsis subvermispora (strain B) TaxID=914234 RepID=M2R1R6_CERS8|nr:hypothetical protein CERSUDRAFT_161359 [Gelatoporia subvermispora B]
MSSGNYASIPPPVHRQHNSDDVLPGAQGGLRPADYSTEVTNDSRTWKSNNERQFGAGTDTGAVMAGGQHDSPEQHQARSQSDVGHNAFSEDRPLGVEPTSEGGVAVGGQDNLPEGHAKLTDKLIGKTQKASPMVAGKMMNKPDMHEKGELREAGGKAAVTGDARAPHD